MPRPIYQIAQEIKDDWKNIPIYAKAYLDPMFHLNKITDHYFLDDAKGIILYFLSNAQTWKGETAKRIKAELKELCK